MKISIITPSYNQARFVEQTILSVLNQNCKNVEYIVMDGGSTDGTVEILKKYDGKIIWESEKDNGQSDAVNKGWRKATGDVITYLNSDDYYEPNVLRKVTDYFVSNPNTKWAYGGWNFVNKKGLLYKSAQPETFKKQKLLDYCNIGQPSCFFKKELLEEIGMLDEKLHLTMDYDLWLRFANKYPAGIMDFIVSNMRYYPDAKSGAKTMEHLKAGFALCKNYSKRFSWQRLRQIFFFLRGFAVIIFKKDITRRVNSSKLGD